MRRSFTLLATCLASACAVPSPAALGTTAARADAPEPSREPGELAARIHVRCGDADCPEGVGLLVWPDGHELQRCTATLVGEDLVLTAAHCLRPSARQAGARLSDTWIAFPSAPAHPAEWVPAGTVLHAPAVRDDEVLRADVAVIRLARRVERAPLPLAFVPIDRAVIVSVVAARPHPVYGTQHAITTRRCRVATRDSAVGEYGPEAARVGWLVECPSHAGNSGAPVLDARGRVRAILHGGSAPIDGIGITSGLPALAGAR